MTAAGTGGSTGRETLEIAPSLAPRTAFAAACCTTTGWRTTLDSRWRSCGPRLPPRRGALAVTRVRATAVDSDPTTGRAAEPPRARPARGRRARCPDARRRRRDGRLGGRIRATRSRARRCGILPSRGAHLVVPRERIPATAGLTIRVPGKVVFLVPWPDSLADRHDRRAVRRTRRPPVGRRLGDRRAAGDRQRHARCRARTRTTWSARSPACGRSSRRRGGSTVKASREHRVTVESNGVVRIAGGKYTTYRVMARDVIDAVLGPRRSPAPTERHRRSAARRRGRRARARPPGRRDSAAIPAVAAAHPEAAARLVARHGTEAPAVVALGAELDLLRPLVPGRPFLEAEVAWAVRHELALSVDDVLSRRLRLSPELADAAPRSRRRSRRSWPGSSAGASTRCELERDTYLASAAREYGAARRRLRARPAPGGDGRACDRHRGVTRAGHRLRAWTSIGDFATTSSTPSTTTGCRSRSRRRRWSLRRSSSIAWRRGWFAAARRHPGRSAIALAVALAVGDRWPGTSPRRSGSGRRSSRPVQPAAPAIASSPAPSVAASAPTAPPTSAATAAPDARAHAVRADDGRDGPVFRHRRVPFRARDRVDRRGRARPLPPPARGLQRPQRPGPVRLPVDRPPTTTPTMPSRSACSRRPTARSATTCLTGTDPSRFRSAIIWCKQFSHLFAVAPFGSDRYPKVRAVQARFERGTIPLANATEASVART